MRKINRIVRKDIGLGFLRGCSIPQFVDRVTKLVSDCLDQINEFYDVLSTVKAFVIFIHNIYVLPFLSMLLYSTAISLGK